MHVNAVDIVKAFFASVGHASIGFVVGENKPRERYIPIGLPEVMPISFHQTPCDDLDRSSLVFLFDQERVGEGWDSGHVLHQHLSLMKTHIEYHLGKRRWGPQNGERSTAERRMQEGHVCARAPSWVEFMKPFQSDE